MAGTIPVVVSTNYFLVKALGGLYAHVCSRTIAAVDNRGTLTRREISSPLDELLIREAVQLGFNSRSNNRGSLKVCVDTYLTGHLPMPLHAKEFIVPLATPRYYYSSPIYDKIFTMLPDKCRHPR